MSGTTKYPSDADTDSAASPAKWFHFILADEWDPTRGKLVRKVVFPQRLQNSQALLEQILRPERHGFMPRNPGSQVTLGRHVLGMTDSRFISTSRSLFGSPRFEGRRYWIDEQRLRASGATVHDAADIIADLDRIAAKNANRPAFRQYIEDIKRKSLVADREAVIEGAVLPGAVKGATAMAATRGLQFLQGVGIVITVYDIEQAGVRSVDTRSARPLAAEAMRQAGGCGGALLGMKLGAAGGALVGIETGPGAVVSAAGGAFIFGVAGYFGASWAAELIDRPASATIAPASTSYLKFEDWDRHPLEFQDWGRRP